MKLGTTFNVVSIPYEAFGKNLTKYLLCNGDRGPMRGGGGLNIE